MIRRSSPRKALTCLFAFVAAATFGFLAIKNQQSTSAADLSQFRAGNIMSDAVMSDNTTMSVDDIQRFLKSKNSCNDTRLYLSSHKYDYLNMDGNSNHHVKDGHFVCMADENFDGESAAQIIWQAGQDYHINPQVLIVLLQKEQSLVTDTLPRSGQYRAATGYGCPDTAACDAKYYGFKNQVRNAAALFHSVLSGGWSNYNIGWNYIKYGPNCGEGSDVYIENRATASLYRYTPYQPSDAVLGGYSSTSDPCSAYGNRNFYAFFTDWFGSTQVTKNYVPVYPSDLYLPEDRTYQIVTNSGRYLGFDDKYNGSSARISRDVTDVRFVRTPEGFYTIYDVKTGRVLDVSNASKENGAKVQLWDHDESTCAQKWSVKLVDDKYAFQSVCSGKYLDIPNSHTAADDLDLQIWDRNDSTSAQVWYLIDTSEAPLADGLYSASTEQDKSISGSSDLVLSSDYHKLKFLRSVDGFYTIAEASSDRVFDVSGGSTSDGAKVQLYNRNNSCAQRWIPKYLGGNAFAFFSSCSNKVLDVRDGKIGADGANIQIWSDNDSPAQRWILDSVESTDEYLPEGDYTIRTTSGKYLGSSLSITSSAHDFHFYRTDKKGYYTIVDSHSKQAIDVVGASHVSGTEVQLYNRNDSCAQQWALKNLGGAKYALYSVCSGKALDVRDGRISVSGTKAQIWDANNSPAQTWIIEAKSSAPIENDSAHYIESTSGKTLSTETSAESGNFRTASGASLEIADSTLSVNKYKYRFSRLANGLYQITHDTSGNNLDLSGGLHSSGARLQLYRKNDTCSQQWAIIPSGSTYTFISACSGKAVDIKGGEINTNGTAVQTWDANKSAAQTWYINSVSDNRTVADGRYSFTSAINSDLALEISGGANHANNGSNIQLWDKNTSTGKEFEVSYHANRDAYIIKSTATGRVIDLSNARLRSGSNIQIWNEDSGTCAQFWRFQKQNDGTYAIVSSCGDYVMDVTNGQANNGSNIQLWNYNASPAQRWQLNYL